MIDGRTDAPILFVGMAPGRDELTQQRPFVGGSGKFMWRIFAKVGITRDMVYIVNTIGEWPEGSTGSPSKAQLYKYWDAFDEACKAFAGRLVVCLGGDAFRRYTGIAGGIEDWSGYIVQPPECQQMVRMVEEHTTYLRNTGKNKKGDPRVVKHKMISAPPIAEGVHYILPMHDPVGVMRTGFQTAPAFAACAERVKRALDGRLRWGRTTFVEHPVLTTDGSPIAFDIENDIQSRVITRMGVANAVDTWSVPWGANAKDASRAALADTRAIKFAHNIAHDLRYLEDNDVPIADPIFCTMLGAAMLQPDLYKGLNPVAGLYLDRHRWKHLSEDQPAFYNANDASATLELGLLEREKLAATGQLKLMDETIMPGVRELVNMTRIGMKIDMSRRDSWLAELRAREVTLVEEWRSLVGEVNPSSPKQLQGLLYGTLGLPTQFHKYGGVTTDELALRKLMVGAPSHVTEIIHKLLSLREVSKQRSTYGEIAVHGDGCVHPGYMPASKDVDGHGFNKGLAGTWRITGRDPNPQNIPMEARKLYVPHKDGMVLVAMDFNQIEARILAALSGDEVLQAAIERGLHQSNMERLGVDKVRAKNAFYGWSYLAGPTTLRNTFLQHGYDLSFAECKRLLGFFDSEYHKAAAYREQIIRDMREQLYVTNPFGLRRYFYSRDQASAAVNFVPQSTAAIITWKLLPKLGFMARDHGGNLLTLVHDEFLFELPWEIYGCKTPEDLINDLSVGDLRQTMEQEWPEIAPRFRVPVGVKIGPNWGEMKEIT